MQILMNIDVGQNPPAVRIVLQIIDNTVYLIHHSFLILMFHSHLISVRLSDGSVFICPAVPDMRFQVMDVVGFALPDPEH